MRVPAEDIRTTGDRLFRLAQDIRYSPDFLPQGTNVTLLGELSSDSILSKTYERGVEGFTLSCGTGAVAAARSQQRRSGASTIKVSVPGGDLQVVFDSSGVFLSGAAVLIAALDLTPEFLRHLSGSAIS
jgi:diaminopimelate epimerase